jgi:selenocysteine lyase/cysteine desulfurase
MTPAEARAEFPLLETCVYLNNNSLGALPRGAREAASAYYDVFDRWRDEAYGALAAEMQDYADDVAALIGAPSGSVVLDANVSALLGRVLSCFDWRERPRAVTSDLEFPSAAFVLSAQRRLGCEPVIVPSRDGARIDVEGVCEAMNASTRIVVVSHAAFATGSLTPLEPIVKRARDVGALVAVDAYQTVGVVPVDVGALGVDFLFGGAHKWLSGAFDCAFAYVRPELVASLEPSATGWMASGNPMSFGPAAGWAPDARRLAAGTPAPLPAITSREGLRILRSVGVPAIREISLARTARIIARADEAGLEVVTPRDPRERGGIVTLTFPRSADVVAALKRAGFVCSHRGGARIAPHFYNTDDEVERFMDALVLRARAGA